MSIWKSAPGPEPPQSHLGEEEQAAELEGFHSVSPALCYAPPARGGFAGGRDVSGGWQCWRFPSSPRQQPCWWQGALWSCWAGAALPSPPADHLELEHRLGLRLIRLRGGSVPRRYRDAWERAGFCGPSEHHSKRVGLCEGAPGCPGHCVTFRAGFGSRG